MKNSWLPMTLTAGAIAGVPAGTTSLTTGAHVAARCGETPQVSWWADPTHESTVGYVNRRHGGDIGFRPIPGQGRTFFYLPLADRCDEDQGANQLDAPGAVAERQTVEASGG